MVRRESGDHRPPLQCLRRGEADLTRAVRAVLLLPANTLVTIPAAILWFEGGASFRLATALAGALLAAAGLSLLAWTVRLFAVVGEGTLAPWDPTKRPVFVGPYRHVRNPMYCGVVGTMLGEGIFFGSPGILLWGCLFLAVVHFWVIFFEEADAARRFGEAYLTYRKNVPRWIPRLTPWNETTIL